MRNEFTFSSPGCNASECHISTSLQTYPPETGKHSNHLSAGFNCDTCHNNYIDNAFHKNGINDSENGKTIVIFNAVNPGASWNDPVTTCESMACHGNADWYGTASFGCTDCHYSGSVIDPLVINGSGTDGKHQKHVSEMGIACEKCHYNYKSTSTHADSMLDADNSSINITLFDSTNPSGAWINDSGSNTGSCSSLVCHGAATLGWYGSDTWILPPCSTCHNSTIGTRRQVLGNSGDFALNLSIVSKHVAGGSDPAEEQCLVCHDMSAHMSNTVRLKNADTGSAIVYDSSDASTLEPFCLSCHDADGATITYAAGGSADDPFNEGVSLGVGIYTAGNKIESYWNNTYTVHKNNGLTCAGSGEPGTGCHGNNESINMHGSVNRGILTKNLTLPIPSYDTYNYDHYKLCFDCHESYPSVTKEVILGIKQNGNYDVSWIFKPYYTTGIQSQFRDRYISSPANYPSYWGGLNQTYNDSTWGYDPYVPLHNWHLSYYDYFYDGWKYRGDAVNTGRLSCITCHNVHGTAGSIRSTYDEFGIVAGINGIDEYKQLVNYGDSTLTNYPINCNISCHGMSGALYYWNTPANE